MLSFCPRVGTEAGFSFCFLKIRSQKNKSNATRLLCFYFETPSPDQCWGGFYLFLFLSSIHSAALQVVQLT